MNNYELLYIIDSAFEEEAREALIAKVNALIEANEGAVESTDKWGMKKLAYPINYKSEGFYVLANFTAPATFIDELDRVFGITEGLVRHMVIRK